MTLTHDLREQAVSDPHPERSVDKRVDKEEKRTFFRKLTELIRPGLESREELLAALAEAEDHGLIGADSRAMLEGVIRMADMTAGDVMVAAPRMDLLNIDAPFEDLLYAVIDTGHSRFPVYSGERENIIGILMAKDLLKLQRAPELNLRTLLRPVVFVPESKGLNDLLREFRASRYHLAVVIDEFGQVAGLITIDWDPVQPGSPATPSKTTEAGCGPAASLPAASRVSPWGSPCLLRARPGGEQNGRSGYLLCARALPARSRARTLKRTDCDLSCVARWCAPSHAYAAAVQPRSRPTQPPARPGPLHSARCRLLPARLGPGQTAQLSAQPRERQPGMRTRPQGLSSRAACDCASARGPGPYHDSEKGAQAPPRPSRASLA